MGKHSARVASTPELIEQITPARDEQVTELIPVLPAGPRRDARLARQSAKQRAQRKLRMRATYASVTSLFAGFGASTVLTGTGQQAEAMNPGPPVTSSLATFSTASAEVPDALASDADAADIDRYLSTQEVAADLPATCDPTWGANGMLSAMVAEPDAGFVMPVAEGDYRLTSGYGARWNPTGSGYQNHLGTDFAAPTGTPIYAIASGTVEYVGIGKDGRSSNLIIIKHDVDGQVFWSWYVHMYDDGLHVEVGDEVTAGQYIADVGNNGNSTGSHLHLEIHTGDGETTINPLTFLTDNGAKDISEVCN